MNDPIPRVIQITGAKMSFRIGLTTELRRARMAPVIANSASDRGTTKPGMKRPTR